MNNEKKQEFTRKITQANSVQMIVVIYDIALEYANDAKTAGAKIQNSTELTDAEGFHIAIGKLQGCFSQLCGSLNFACEPAKTLNNLYHFCIRRIGEAELKKDSSLLDEVISIVGRLRDAYEKVAAQSTEGPVMGNSQEVYAGLTYGRGELNENYVGQNNRGFLV